MLTWSVRSRRAAWFTIGGWLLLVALLPRLVPALADVENNRGVDDPPARAESMRAAALLRAAFPDQRGLPAIVVVRNAHGLTEDDRARVTRMADALSTVGAVVPQQPVSADGTTTQVIVAIPGDPSEPAFGGHVDRVRAIATSDPGPLEVHVTGPAGIVRDTVKAFGGANLTLLFATLGLVLVLLLAIYRSPLLALVPLLTVGVAIQLSQAIGAGLAKAGLLTVNSQAASIMTVLLFGVGTDYCLFLISRYREELQVTDDRWAAMRVALRRVAEPMLSSAATVFLALLALLLATLPALRGFGPFLALSVVVLVAVALTLVPALVVVLGRAAFWPGRAATGRTPWGAIAGFVLRRPRRTVAAGLLFLAVLSLGLLGYRDTYDFVSGFRVPTESAAGQRLLQQAFPPGQIAPTTVVVTDPGAVEPVRAAARGIPGVLSVTEPHTAPSGVSRFTVTFVDNPYETPALDRTALLRNRVRAAAPHTQVLVAGESAKSLDLRHANRRDLFVVAPITLLLIALVLVVLLRGIVAPLYLVGTILASFAATLGFTVTVLLGVLGDHGMGVRVTLYIFVFLVALGVDYNILLATRIREETRHRAPAEGIRVALTRTGGVISSAGVILAGTFLVLTTQPIRELFQFGVAMTAGLLIDTFLVRGTLVPALAVMWTRRPRDADRPAHRQQVG